jgi:hypothetical protein
VIRDPAARGHGAGPYDALAPAGITPHSSAAEVLDASFELMARGLMTPEVRQAWDELRAVERRLVVDFFYYEIDLEAQIAAATLELERDLFAPSARGLDVPPLAVDVSDLASLREEVRDVVLPPVHIRPLREFDDPPLPGPEIVEFDR